MINSLFPWQSEPWQQLQQLCQRLPHAILFYGPAGIGKTVFAEHFAQSLLCETPLADGHACGACGSCGWFVQYSHPDYRRVRPEVLDEDEGSEDADAVESGEAKKSAKSTKAPSRDIRIDQIRALGDFMNVSTHRQGKRVVLLYPAEALNAASSNALLKTLEEPPANTVFILVSNSLDRLLPTILSRCRKFALPMPTHDQALAWLRQQNVKDPEAWLAEQGGAPLTASSAAQGDAREAVDALLQHLSKPGIEGALKAAEQLQKAPMTELVASMQRWLYDVFSVKLTGKIRYFPRYQKELTALAKATDTGRLLQLLKGLNERRAVAEHPLSARLFIEDMLLDYSKLYT
jgi:DNA polymerase-3 subunit delta'